MLGFLRRLTPLALTSLVACTATTASDTESATGQALTTTELRFGADGSVRASGALVAGEKVQIVYDAARMSDCRGDSMGSPAWTITAYVNIDGTKHASIGVAGLNAHGAAEIALPKMFAKDAELYFQITNRWGCTGYDSNSGRNYHFPVTMPAGEAVWAGNAAQTREGDALARATVEVFEAGVTNHDGSPWRELGVKLHVRRAGFGPYAESWADFDARVGDNARFAGSLRAYNPFTGAAPSSRSGCPRDAQIGRDPATGNPQHEVEYYFSVNGYEVRPKLGESFRGVFTSADHGWLVCAP